MVASRVVLGLGLDLAIAVVVVGEDTDDPLVRQVGRSLRLALPVRGVVVAHLGVARGVDSVFTGTPTTMAINVFSDSGSSIGLVP